MLPVVKQIDTLAAEFPVSQLRLQPPPPKKKSKAKSQKPLLQNSLYKQGCVLACNFAACATFRETLAWSCVRAEA